jgi:hypothetical protein
MLILVSLLLCLPNFRAIVIMSINVVFSMDILV